ncbi:MAG: biotin-dependent carboxyltransferase family protein [Pseudomonadota bacterium]
MIEVIKPGTLTTIQSRPRLGLRHRGVPSGGAADPLSLALANRLVGNQWDAPALEATLIGPVLKFTKDCSVAIAGGATASLLNGDDVNRHATINVRAGDTLSVGVIRAGARCYIAFSGGLDVPEVLGSASTNLQAEFGGYKGRALAANDELVARGGVVEPCETPDKFRLTPSSSIALRTCESPETDLLSETSHASLFSGNWLVDQRADRMGIRLGGETLTVRSDGRMPSAAVFPGTVQCPEDGAPYLLGVDAGTVGGYPRVAQVARLDRHLLGQLRPGDRVRFVKMAPDEALQALRGKQDYWREWLPDIDAII